MPILPVPFPAGCPLYITLSFNFPLAFYTSIGPPFDYNGPMHVRRYEKRKNFDIVNFISFNYPDKGLLPFHILKRGGGCVSTSFGQSYALGIQ